MVTLSAIFNNREIAIGAWAILAFVVLVFTKSFQQFLKSVAPILFCRKFIIFYIVFLSYFFLVIYLLHAIGFWTLKLLKDTIFWIVFVELPLFFKTIDKAKDNHFFIKLLKENVALVSIIGFVLNYWTFSLLAEMIIVPVTVFLALLYALKSRKNQHQKVMRLWYIIIIISGIVVVINTITQIFQNPTALLSMDLIKEFLLPILLLFLNLPIAYGLALYNNYEQIFILLRGEKSQKNKIKRSIVLFAGINLSKVSAIRNHSTTLTDIGLTNNDVNDNLKKLGDHLFKQPEKIYIKKLNFFIFYSTLILIIFLISFASCNLQFFSKQISSLNFVISSSSIRELIIYISTIGIAASFFSLVYFIVQRKKERKSFFQVKKAALNQILLLLRRQCIQLKSFIPIDAPKDLFSKYLIDIYSTKAECDKNFYLFESLLSTWELESIKQLQISARNVVYSVGIDERGIDKYTPENFDTYYIKEKKSSFQNGKSNFFISDIKKRIKAYSIQVNLCIEEFKPYIR